MSKKRNVSKLNAKPPDCRQIACVVRSLTEPTELVYHCYVLDQTNRIMRTVLGQKMCLRKILLQRWFIKNCYKIIKISNLVRTKMENKAFLDNGYHAFTEKFYRGCYCYDTINSICYLLGVVLSGFLATDS